MMQVIRLTTQCRVWLARSFIVSSKERLELSPVLYRIVDCLDFTLEPILGVVFEGRDKVFTERVTDVCLLFALKLIKPVFELCEALADGLEAGFMIFNS